MEYHMLYMDSRKSFKIRREKKLIYLPSAKTKTLGKIISLPSAKGKHSTNLLLCRVPLTDTRQTPNGRHTNWRMSTWWFFAVSLFCWMFFLVHRVVFCRHSAKSLFVECHYFAKCGFCSTRHTTFLPSARWNTLDKYFCTRQICYFR